MKQSNKKRHSKIENIITLIVLAVLAIIIVWSAGHLLYAFLEYHKGQSEYSDIREEYGVTEAAVDETLAPGLEEKEQDLLGELQNEVESKLATVAEENEETGEDGTDEAEVAEDGVTKIIKKTITRYTGERQYIRDGSIMLNGVNISYYIAASYQMDLSGLKAINSDVLGWIQIEGTNVDYPFVRAYDNETYIRQTIYGTTNAAGSIFIDCNVSAPFETQNTIIYGHNQRNKQMFHDLTYYEDSSYCNEHPVVLIYLENETRIYQIFSCYITQNVSVTYDCNYSSDAEYQSYLDQITSWSLYDTGVMVSTSDQIITLSTCTNDWEDKRFVVHAKRIV